MVLAISPPGYLQGGTYDAVKDRQYLVTTRFYKESSVNNGRARSGLLPDNQAWSAPISNTGFDVTIGPFRAVITNAFAANAGDYIVVSPQNETRTLAGSSPTTNRIDVIGVVVNDAFYAGADVNADVVVIQGAASAGTPAVPTIPGNVMPLYRLAVNANSTAPVVTDVRQRTSHVGGSIPIFDNQIGQGGVNYGEHRVFPASGAMPHRNAMWGLDGVWHGMTPFMLDLGGWVFTSSTANRAIATVSIPDPGYPYKLSFSINVFAGFDGLNGWYYRMRDGVGAGGTLQAQGAWQTREPSNVFTGPNSIAVVGGNGSTMTGARTMTLWAERLFGAGTQGMSVTSDSYGNVMVVPA